MSGPSREQDATERPPRSAGRHSLQGVGEEPDPRFTFANERTFLAWNRTALALIAAGLGAAQLLHFGFAAARYIVSLPLIALGGLLAVASYRHWRESERSLRLGSPLPHSRLPLTLGIGIVAVALVAAVLALTGAAST